MSPLATARRARRLLAAMPRVHPRPTCKICGGHRSVVGDLSARGKCQNCATGRFQANNDQLVAHDGPWFEHWRRRTALSVGALLVDDLIDAS